MKKLKNPFVHIEGYNCFGCSPTNPLGLHLHFYEDGEEIVSSFRPDFNHQGWLNTLHGGIQSALLDEICGWVVMRKLQTAGVTSKMETKFLHPVATDSQEVELRAHILEQKRNLVTIEATLSDSAGKVCTKALCTYFAFSPQKAQETMLFSGCEAEE